MPRRTVPAGTFGRQLFAERGLRLGQQSPLCNRCGREGASAAHLVDAGLVPGTLAPADSVALGAGDNASAARHRQAWRRAPGRGRQRDEPAAEPRREDAVEGFHLFESTHESYARRPVELARRGRPQKRNSSEEVNLPLDTGDHTRSRESRDEPLQVFDGQMLCLAGRGPHNRLPGAVLSTWISATAVSTSSWSFKRRPSERRNASGHA